jgi:predicted nucleic acid-binding protein
VALDSLARYDGSAGFLVDTNVWVDCIDDTSPWNSWATETLQTCSERAPLHVNLVIYSELLIPGTEPDLLDSMLEVYSTLRSPLPWACAPLAAAAYRLYKRRSGAKLKPLPDFFIGAHAAVANLSVLTRDPKPYRSYFARLNVISP